MCKIAHLCCESVRVHQKWGEKGELSERSLCPVQFVVNVIFDNLTFFIHFIKPNKSLRPGTNLEFVLLPVDDDGGDLLVHKDQNGDQQSRDGGRQVHPPRVAAERGNEPAPVWTRGLWTEGRGG